jgi:hypothetical protein
MPLLTELHNLVDVFYKDGAPPGLLGNTPGTSV